MTKALFRFGIIIGLVSAASCSLSEAELERRRNDLRIIPVCVLIPEYSLLRIDHLLDVFSAVSQEYEEHVGIKFEVIHIFTYPTAENKCSDRAEIKILLKDDIFFYDLGRTSRTRGLIVIFQASAQLYEYTHYSYGVRTSELQLTLKHELAHFFYDGHSNDADSFMYESIFSNVRWTPEVEREILKNKYEKWGN